MGISEMEELREQSRSKAQNNRIQPVKFRSICRDQGWRTPQSNPIKLTEETGKDHPSWGNKIQDPNSKGFRASQKHNTLDASSSRKWMEQKENPTFVPL